MKPLLTENRLESTVYTPADTLSTLSAMEGVSAFSPCRLFRSIYVRADEQTELALRYLQ